MRNTTDSMEGGLAGLPMTELLRECYEASAALGASPDDAALERYDLAMSELERREGLGRPTLQAPGRIEIETPVGTLVATTERSYEDSRAVEVLLELPDGTEGQVAMVEVVSGGLAFEGESPLRTFCWDGRDESYSACVEVDLTGEAMRCASGAELDDLATGRWRAHLVMPGDRYGRGDALTYTQEDAARGGGLPLVEFYDMSADPTQFPCGQFVSRYNMDTLLGLPGGYGEPIRDASALSLYGDVPAWTISGDDLKRVANWLDAAFETLRQSACDPRERWLPPHPGGGPLARSEGMRRGPLPLKTTTRRKR